MYSQDKSKTYRDLHKISRGTLRGTAKMSLTNTFLATLKRHSPEQAAICPFGVDENDWIAIHVFEFYKDLNFLYAIVMDDCTREKCPRMTAGHAYEYLWITKAGVKPTHLPAHEYIDNLFDQVETSLMDEYLFPTNENDSYPDDFIKKVSELLKRLFRVYAHIYFNHFNLLQLVEGTNDFICSFQNFVYFVGYYHLVNSIDMKPCYKLIINHCVGSVAYKELSHEEQVPGSVTDMSVPFPNAGPIASSIPAPPLSLTNPPPVVNSPYNVRHSLLPVKEETRTNTPVINSIDSNSNIGVTNPISNDSMNNQINSSSGLRQSLPTTNAVVSQSTQEDPITDIGSPIFTASTDVAIPRLSITPTEVNGTKNQNFNNMSQNSNVSFTSLPLTNMQSTNVSRIRQSIPLVGDNTNTRLSGSNNNFGNSNVVIDTNNQYMNKSHSSADNMMNDDIDNAINQVIDDKPITTTISVPTIEPIGMTVVQTDDNQTTDISSQQQNNHNIQNDLLKTAAVQAHLESKKILQQAEKNKEEEKQKKNPSIDHKQLHPTSSKCSCCTIM